MEENAQEATREERGKQHKYQTIPYQNQNFISISRKIIVPWMAVFSVIFALKPQKNLLNSKIFSNFARKI